MGLCPTVVLMTCSYKTWGKMVIASSTLTLTPYFRIYSTRPESYRPRSMPGSAASKSIVASPSTVSMGSVLLKSQHSYAAQEREDQEDAGEEDAVDVDGRGKKTSVSD